MLRFRNVSHVCVVAVKRRTVDVRALPVVLLYYSNEHTFRIKWRTVSNAKCEIKTVFPERTGKLVQFGLPWSYSAGKFSCCNEDYYTGTALLQFWIFLCDRGIYFLLGREANFHSFSPLPFSPSHSLSFSLTAALSLPFSLSREEAL